MAVTFFRILLAPVLIVTATMLGRRFGPEASGWFIGFPIISGPISLILATSNGHEFAVNAALGTLGGQASICLFSAVYFLAARRLPWWLTAPLAIATYMVSAFLWNSFHLPLIPSLAVLVGLILLLGWAIPARKIQQKPLNLWWDLPARMLISILFVTGVTAFATKLGPQLSGLFSTLPIFATILSTFTHAQQGGSGCRATHARNHCRFNRHRGFLPGYRHPPAPDRQPVGLPVGGHSCPGSQWSLLALY